MEENKQSHSVEDFETTCRQLLELRDSYDFKKNELKRVDEQIMEVERKLQAMLEAEDKTKYVSEVGTVYTSVHESVAVPKGEARAAFFSYLKEQGIYDEVVTVNSQWLNGYFRKEKEAAIEKGDILFQIPGLENPHAQVRLSFRKA